MTFEVGSRISWHALGENFGGHWGGCGTEALDMLKRALHGHADGTEDGCGAHDKRHSPIGITR